MGILLLFCSESIFSQNLDFELHSKDLLPIGWAVNTVKQQIKLDSSNSSSGDLSLHLFSDQEKSVSSVFQVMDINEQFPKKVILSAYIKSKGDNGIVAIWCRVDGINKQLLYKHSGKKELDDNDGWTLIELEVDVPDNGESLSFGIVGVGNVNAWVDNFSIQPSLFKEALEAEKYLNFDTALKFDNENSKSITESLGLMRNKFERAKIVALGENTHGAKEIFNIRAEIFKYLYENHGYKVLAIEYSLPETFAINKRLSNPDLSMKEILRGMYFWVYYCEEFADLLEWVRKERLENKSPYPKIVGIDMQYYQAALGFVNKYFSQNNCKDCDQIISEINNKIKSFRESNNEQDLKDIKNLTADLISYLEEIDLDSQEIKESKEFIRKNINIIYQSLNKKNELYRDSLMYENVKWWMNIQAEKMVVWAHNNHIRENENSFGEMLNTFLGDEAYLTFGFLFKKGEYRGRSKDGQMNSYILTDPLKGSYEENFSSHVAEGDFIMTLNDIGQKSNNDLQGCFYREIGAFPVDQEYYFNNLIDDFDNVIFLQKITATKPFSNTE